MEEDNNTRLLMFAVLALFFGGWYALIWWVGGQWVGLLMIGLAVWIYRKMD